jgi:hypothetical protein
VLLPVSDTKSADIEASKAVFASFRRVFSIFEGFRPSATPRRGTTKRKNGATFFEELVPWNELVFIIAGSLLLGFPENL